MDKELQMSNIPSMPVTDIVNNLADMYGTFISKELPVKRIPAVMLWGPPGVGKSQAVREIAENLKTKTGKTAVVTDVRLMLFNPIDLRGIPTSNADKTLAVWLKPKIFQMDEGSDVINILFLDEISAAPQSVQAAAYQITLDRVIGEHRLPDNCIVIAAGNRITDKSVAYKMPKALANRLMHMEVEISFEAWKDWAIKNDIHPMVIGFLSYRNAELMAFDTNRDDLVFATPRSWEMVSNILYASEKRLDELFNLIAGVIGLGAASDLCTWAEVYKDLPDIEGIFEGTVHEIPKKTDSIYALISSMTTYAKAHRDDMDMITNSLRYAIKLPPDFSVILIKGYLSFDENYRMKLVKNPEFERLMRNKGSILNGII